MKQHKLDDEASRKTALFLLAAFCAFGAGQGMHALTAGISPTAALRGGGELLFWGGLAAALLARAHRHELAGIRCGIWIGAALIVISWLY